MKTTSNLGTPNLPETAETTGFFALNKPILILLTVVSLLIIALLSIKSLRKRMNIRTHTGFAIACTLIAVYLGCASGKETSLSLYLFSLTPALLCYLFVLLAAINAVFAALMLRKSSNASNQ